MEMKHMNGIWQDAEIKQIIETLKKKKRKKKFYSKEIPRNIFVCGKQILDESGRVRPAIELEDNIRYYILELLDKKQKENEYGKRVKFVNCMLSEKLYTQDWAEDVLSFEEVLAEISDWIIIVVESPGTYCELGAFVLKPNFMEKTYIINEDKPDYKKSFITRGPIKKVSDYNSERVILHNGLENIKISTEFNEKIAELAEKEIEIVPTRDANNLELKTIINEFANIVELLQPIEKYEIQEIYKKIFDIDRYEIKNKRFHKIKTFADVIDLMEDMEILIKKNGRYLLKDTFSYYNVIAGVERKEFNNLRLKYLSRVYKLQPKRMG